MRNVERIDGASYTPTARILLQNIDVRAEIISKKRGDSQKTDRTPCADYISEYFFFADEKTVRTPCAHYINEIIFFVDSKNTVRTPCADYIIDNAFIVDSKNTVRTPCADHINESFFFVDEKNGAYAARTPHQRILLFRR